MKGISEKTLIKIKDLKASVKLNNGDMLTTVTNANMELQRGRSYAIVGKSEQLVTHGGLGAIQYQIGRAHV